MPSIFQEQILEVDVGETAIVAAFEEVQVQRDDTNPVIFPEDLGSMGRDLDPPTAAQPVVDQPLQGSRFYLRLEAVKEDDKMMAYYSGFKSYNHFLYLFSFLCPEIYSLDYKPKCLSEENQLFLTLIKLRRGKDNTEIAFLFGINDKTVSSIFNTFLRFLYFMFKDLDLWCPRAVVNLHMPAGFKNAFPNTRTILDATECRIEKPSNVADQVATYSTYKNSNTVKTIIGITPQGTVNYISDSYAGSASDRMIIERSDLIHWELVYAWGGDNGRPGNTLPRPFLPLWCSVYYTKLP